ncbi:MAG: PEP-CTERM sorting domain-containing protein [Planctomycetota bacterium]
MQATLVVSWPRFARPVSFAGLVGALWLCAASAVGQATLTSIGLAPNGGGTTAEGVNGDGSVVAVSGGSLLRWTPTGGLEDLGTMPGGTFANGRGVSFDGTAIVGWGDVAVGPGLALHAFRWTAATGVVSLGSPNLGPSGAESVSGDGAIVVGGSGSPCPFPASQYNNGYSWTSGGGWQPLPLCSDDWNDTTALGVSADGTVVVGSGGAPGSYFRAFRWTAAGGTQNLGTLATGPFAASAATAVSADGSTVVGVYWENAAGGYDRSFRWTAAGGMQDLGALPGGAESRAESVSGDGSVIVGTAAMPSGPVAYVWTAATGMVDLNELLPALGVDISGWGLRYGIGVSADGSTIVGNGQAPAPGGGAWVARITGTSWASPWTNLGSDLAGVAGPPSLVGTGTLVAASAGSLSLSAAAPSALSLLVLSIASTPVPFKCGTLVPVPILTNLLLFTNPAGTIAGGWSDWPAGLSGLSIYWQYAVQDAAAVCGVALSNALRADVP